MMGPGFGDGIAQAIVTFVILVAVVSFVLGAGVVWTAPIFWEWVKPLIHALTA